MKLTDEKEKELVRLYRQLPAQAQKNVLTLIKIGIDLTNQSESDLEERDEN